MGGSMNKILDGLYVGNYKNAHDATQLKANGITHILSIHDNATPDLYGFEYFCVHLSDTQDADIAHHFEKCNDFIHNARAQKGHVLVHCHMGISRSVTIVVAYLMSVADVGWQEALMAVKVARKCADPNLGFQKQLMEFEASTLQLERERIGKMFPASQLDDKNETRSLLDQYKALIVSSESFRRMTTELFYPLSKNAYNTATSSKHDNIATPSILDNPKISKILIEGYLGIDETKNGGSVPDEELLDHMFSTGRENVTGQGTTGGPPKIFAELLTEPMIPPKWDKFYSPEGRAKIAMETEHSENSGTQMDVAARADSTSSSGDNSCSGFCEQQRSALNQINRSLDSDIVGKTVKSDKANSKVITRPWHDLSDLDSEVTELLEVDKHVVSNLAPFVIEGQDLFTSPGQDLLKDQNSDKFQDSDVDQNESDWDQFGSCESDQDLVNSLFE